MSASTPFQPDLEIEQPATPTTPVASRWVAFWSSIRTKITLPFLVLSLILAGAMAVILYQMVFENIDQRFNTQLVESGKLASGWMVKEENSRLGTLRLLAYTQGVGDALRERDPKQLQILTYPNVAATQEGDIEFLDTSGKLVLSMRHRPDSQNVEDYLVSSGGDTDFRQWTFVEKVLAQQTDELGSKYSGLARASFGDYFYVAGPIYDSQGDFAGVVLVGESVPDLLTKMRKEILAQVTIYDLTGKVVGSTFTPPILNPAQLLGVLKNRYVDTMRRDGLTYSDIQYSELLGPWKVRGNDILGLLGVALPKNLLVDASNTIRIQIAGLIGLMLLLVLLLGGYVADRITLPLLNLVKASKDVALGNLTIRVERQSNDEVAVLTENFNQMVMAVEKSQADLLKAYTDTLEGWTKALDLRDAETEGHTQRVAMLTYRLAKRMGLKGEALSNIYRGALLHDIGKICVPDAILRKTASLTADEQVQLSMHPGFAYEMLYPIEYLRPALDIPYCHHEKWDGSGYPRGLKGEEIPLAARIFAVVDVWDTMTSDRVYRKALSEEEAVRYLIENREKHFAPGMVDDFLTMLSMERKGLRG